MIPLIDSHAHLTGETLRSKASELLLSAKKQEIIHVVNIATTLEEMLESFRLEENHPYAVSTVAGITPHDAGQDPEEELFFSALANHASKGKLRAIGEIGLDNYNSEASVEKQEYWFKEQIILAYECGLPIAIHCRNAFGRLFELCDSLPTVPVLIHCFTGEEAEAKEIIRRRWSLSLSGIITFKKSYQLLQVASELPIEQLLVETDSPYLAPEPHRGATNEPALVRHTAIKLAQAIKSTPQGSNYSIEHILTTFTHNAQQFFRLPRANSSDHSQ